MGLRNAQLWKKTFALTSKTGLNIKNNQCYTVYTQRLNDVFRFESGKPVPDSTFWVVEMIPGVSEMRVCPSKCAMNGFHESERRFNMQEN